MPRVKTTTKRGPRTTKCGVPVKVVDNYGICDVACEPKTKKGCEHHKKKVKK